MESRTDQQAKDKVLELIKDVRIAMMASRGNNGQMHARPMATNTVTFDGSLWFYTDIGLAQDPRDRARSRGPDHLFG